MPPPIPVLLGCDVDLYSGGVMILMRTSSPFSKSQVSVKNTIRPRADWGKPRSKYRRRKPIPMSVCYEIEARMRSLTVFGQPKWPLSHICTCVFLH